MEAEYPLVQELKFEENSWINFYLTERFQSHLLYRHISSLPRLPHKGFTEIPDV